MSDRVTDIMKQTQAKLEKMKETTAIKELRNIPRYMNMRDDEGNKPEDLLNVTAKTPEPEKEWKDVSQVLNDVIKKKKDELKPSRPPPPKQDKPKVTRNPSLVTYDPLNPSWDDSTVQEYYKASAMSVPAKVVEKEERDADVSKEEEKEQEENEEDVSEATPSWGNLEDTRMPSSHSDFFSQAREPTQNGDAFTIPSDIPEEDPFKVKIFLPIYSFSSVIFRVW